MQNGNVMMIGVLGLSVILSVCAWLARPMPVKGGVVFLVLLAFLLAVLTQAGQEGCRAGGGTDRARHRGLRGGVSYCGRARHCGSERIALTFEARPDAHRLGFSDMSVIKKKLPRSTTASDQPARPYAEPYLAQPGESVRLVLSSDTTQTTMEEKAINSPATIASKRPQLE